MIFKLILKVSKKWGAFFDLKRPDSRHSMDSMESGGELCFLSFPPFSDSVGNTLNFEFYLNTLKSSQILKFVLPVVVRTVMNSFFNKKNWVLSLKKSFFRPRKTPSRWKIGPCLKAWKITFLVIRPYFNDIINITKEKIKQY